MNISKSALTLLGIGLVGGVIIAWVLFSVLGAQPNEVSVGPIKFGIPTRSVVGSTSTAMKASAGAPTSAPPLTRSNATPPVSPPAQLMCLSTPYTSLGSDWSIFRTRSTSVGEVETYSHCPPAPKIRYVDMWVDDELDEVKLVCPDPARNQDIREQFSITRRDEVPHFESSTLNVPSGCRIDFTVRDTAGKNIQIGFHVVEVQ